ncbi:MAG: hypothetical protein JNK05_38395 [Myxococcales bacterium]|nr:hypothetical protein [Myxococcales bacterium]
MIRSSTSIGQWFTVAALGAAFAACSAPSTPSDGGAEGGDGTRADSAAQDGSSSDAMTDGTTADSDPGDGATVDADDSSAVDSGVDPDAGVAMDSGVATDSGVPADVANDRPTPVDVAADAAACAPQSCYSGAMGTSGMGVCRAGVRMCIGGMLGVCTGEITPTAEACNGVDDNCDGMVDNLPQIACGVGACRRTVAACAMGAPNACVPAAPAAAEMCGNMMDDDCNGVVDDGCACVHVATSGSDTTGTGSAMAPFRNIQTAIARAGAMGLPTSVCVAQGTYTEDLTMRNGISVRGGYVTGGATWMRTGSLTTITSMAPAGVSFPSTVVSATVLDGFTVNSATGMLATAITVAGATNVFVSNNVINGRGSVDSNGVVITAMPGLARPVVTLSNNNITGGNDATRSSAGVRATGATVLVTGSCATFTSTGQCQTGACGTMRGIRGRTSSTPATLESFGVSLDNSPNSIIERSAICSGAATSAAAVRIVNDATGVQIRQNNVTSVGGTRNSVGVWAEDCGGASPLVSNNSLIAGNSPVMGARADGVRAVGACHAVIAGNTRIVGGIESANNDANGVLCAANAGGVASRCTVLNNNAIQGAGGGFPPNATGVRCERGSCVRIEGNTTITGQSGVNAFGVTIESANPVIARNTIEAGCARTLGVGLQLTNSAARVENNVIYGSRCLNSGGSAAPPARTDGVRIVSTGLAEPDLHSNDIFGEGPLTVGPMCTSRGIAVEANDSAPPGARGVLRNNIVHPGRCTTRAAIAEGHRLADLRLVENNDLHFQAAGDTLYFDENTTALSTVAAVDMLVGAPTASATLSVDPLFVSATNLRLQMGSMCINRGTSAGAPSIDFFGTARPRGAGHDVGAAEF